MIGKLEIVIGDQTHSLDPDEELKMAEETINDDLKNQPSLYAFYAVMQEAAESELAECKLAVETIEAALDDRLRSEALAASSKLTETQLANKIRLNDDFLNATVAYNKAKRQAGMLRAIKEAFVHRKDMLVTLASNMRAQADPSIYVRTQELKKA